MFTKRNHSAFTLVEVIIVVAIIAVLSTIIYVSIGSVRDNSRDDTRIQDMQRVQQALRLFYLDNGYYPNPEPVPSAPESYQTELMYGWDTPADGNFISPLVNGGYLLEEAVDPNGRDYYNPDKPGQGTLRGNYMYDTFPSGKYGCPGSTFYVLAIRDLESHDGDDPDSPGFSCGDRDWQDEPKEWVTGAYR